MLYWKVFASIAIGTVVGAFVEPQITSRLPASLGASGAMQKGTHAVIAGGVGTGVFWAVNKAVK